MVQNFRVLGFDEAITTCDCCGKANLKGTFAVERADGQILHYGSVCVTRHTSKPSKVVRQEARIAAQERLDTARREFYCHPAELAYQSKLDESRRAGLIGVDFMKANRAEREAADAARCAIAEKYGIDVNRLV